MGGQAKVGIVLAAIALFGAAAYAAVEEEKPPTLVERLRNNVAETVFSSSEIPGLQSTELAALRGNIIEGWSKLVDQGVLEVTATDQVVRPHFVALQGVVEHTLATELGGSIKTLEGFIHTPMPATPLCTQGEISPELVDPSIEADPLRLFTVKARTTIVRDFLFKGGHLYVIYPKEGFFKRTETQRAIYLQELRNYPDHLHDMPIEFEIPQELIGASYLFSDQEGNQYLFSIMMTQAKDPQAEGRFGLWFGPVDHPAVEKRLAEVARFIDLAKS